MTNGTLAQSSTPPASKGDEWTFTPDDREKAAVLSLCADQELSPTAVMRQALRLYQSDHLRRKDGETVTWSGDDQRARDFAGPLAIPSNDTLQGRGAVEVMREALTKIANCRSHFTGDVVDVARAALRGDRHDG